MIQAAIRISLGLDFGYYCCLSVVLGNPVSV